jgi:uncharacterized protein (UPF0179 family)
MKINRKIEVKIEPKEMAILQQAKDLLQIICEEFPNCEDDGCPMAEICDNLSIEVGKPHECIKEIMASLEKTLDKSPTV